MDVKRAFSGSRPPCARLAAAPSRCTCSLRKPRKAVLSRGGCQPGLVMAKCMSDNSVFPSSACWYTEASVCPPDNHCAREKMVSRPECLQQPFRRTMTAGHCHTCQSSDAHPRHGHIWGSVTCTVLRENDWWFKLRLESSQIPGDQTACPWCRDAHRRTYPFCDLLAQKG